MILTDYFRSDIREQWTLARQCGVKYGTVRLPEDDGFDVTDAAQWKAWCDGYRREGIQPLVMEPLPNCLHDHIKTGDEKRDESIDKFIKLLPLMKENGLTTVCFNFMAHIGWLRTEKMRPDRGGAYVTGFDMNSFTPTGESISEDALWRNLEYFLKAVLPEAEKQGIRLALHPDDPPVARLGEVSRILVSGDAIRRAMSLVPSPNLGLTFCQAVYYLMGEDMPAFAEEMKEKIFFVHFRNVRGDKTAFHETFHDDGAIDMNRMIRFYGGLREDLPIRVDHVPTLAGEENLLPGYASLGRLFAIGYLKGLAEANGVSLK